MDFFRKESHAQKVARAMRAAEGQTSSGSKKIDRSDHARQVAEGLQAYNFNHNYWILNGENVYQKYTPAEARRFLAKNAKVHKSAYDDALYVFDCHRVDWAGPLSGHQPGQIEYNTKRLLVTEGPKWIESKEGEFPITQALIKELCGEQWQRVVGWLQTARADITKEAFQPGQVLILAGPKGAGKSTLQNRIITPLLGGRAANPFQFMTGQSPFNAHLFGSEHWIIDDKMPHGDPHARSILANYMKQAASVQSDLCHPKGQTPIHLPLFCRLSISCNDDDRSLTVLPEIHEDLEGKLIMVMTRKFEFGWPRNKEQSSEFNARIASELPALAHWVDSFALADGLKEQRYSVTGHIDQALRDKLFTLGKDGQLLALAREAISSHMTLDFPHEDNSYQWFDLINSDTNLRDGLKEITKSPDGLGRIFSRLVNAKAPGISRRIERGRSLYEVDV